MPRKYIALDEAGRRCGESHHRAKLSDAIVDKIRELREDRGFTYGMICLRLSLAKSTVVAICRYERRCSRVDRWRRVEE